MADSPDLDGWNAPGPESATPLDPDDAVGLKLNWVATRADLNEAEQTNILKTHRLKRWRKPTLEQLLDDLELKRLHKDMFGDVWTWAGTYRRRETTVGIDPERITEAVHNLVLDAPCWFGGNRPMTPTVAGCTFHHRLVQIHPFPNGNGRHSRRLTDLLMGAINEPTFTWGSTDLNAPGTVRQTYIAALRAADNGDLSPLAEFVYT